MSESTAVAGTRLIKRAGSAATPKSSPSDIITAGLADAIIDYAIVNRVQPGQRMKEHILAEHFDVSRVPVREALTELSSQGVVYYAPRRGARLMEVDALKLRKVLEVRERMETLALRTALQMFRSEPTAIRPLDQAIAQMEQATAKDDLLGIAKADIAFHRAICLASGNEVLVKAWTAVSRQVLIIFALEQRERPFNYPHVEIHKALRDVLATADYTEAERVLSDHILKKWAIGSH
jgi:DNA-binding GntR family transcriptional regulator